MSAWLSLSFLYPLGLIGIPLGLSGLILIYRRYGKLQRTIVPSLYLLRKFANSSTATRRPFFPLRLLLDLILITIAALGLAGLIQEHKGETITVVIDNSLSMGYQETANETLLQRAKEEAKTYIGKLPQSTRVHIYQSCPTLSALSAEASSVSYAYSLIDKVSLCFAADGQASGIQELDNAGKIKLFTDHPPHSGDNFLAKSQVSITTIGLAASRRNIGIIAIEFSPSKELSLSIRSNLKKAAPVQITVTAPNSSSPKSEWEPLATRNISVPPEGEVTIAIADAKIPQNVPLAVTLTAPDDGFDYDNVGYIATRNSNQTIGVISPTPFRELNLPTYAGIQFKESNEPNNNGGIAPPDVTGLIFHRTTPKTTQQLPHLIIAPPENSAFVQTVRDATGVVSRWHPSHSITRYLELGGIKFSNYRVLTTTHPLETIVAGPRGPLLLAGTIGGVRQAIVGFELLPFEKERSLTASILFLNLASWTFNLNLPSTAKGITGAALIRANVIDSIVPIDESLLTADLREGASLKVPGVYSIETQDAAKSILAYNAFIPGESFTPPDTLNFSPRPSQSQQKTTTPSSLGFLLALVLLGYTLIDLVLMGVLKRRR